MRRTVSTFLTILISLGLVFSPTVSYAAVSMQAADFLCERGINFFDQGKYLEASQEFKKALLANPESTKAKAYLSEIESYSSGSADIFKAELSEKISSINTLLEKYDPGLKKTEATVRGSNSVVNEALDEIDKGRTPGQVKEVKAREALSLQASQAEPLQIEETVIDIRDIVDVGGSGEINTNIGKIILLKGRDIARFLATDPAMLKVQSAGSDSIRVEPLEAGSTYMHVWDEGKRYSLKFVIGPKTFEKEFLEAYKKRMIEESLPESFKVGYSIQGNSYMSGRRLNDMERKNYNLSYSSSVRGETPYGYFDTSVQANRTELKKYHVSNFRMGLTGAHYDELKDINLRFFDFTPIVASFGFPSADLRGAMIDAPMFDKKIKYTAFWGAIPLGNFTALSSTSGLDRTKKAWLEGLAVNYRPWEFANFKTFYATSYGPERTQPVLTDEVRGFGMDYNFSHFNIGAEMAQDPNNISYTANSSVSFSKIRLGLSMTENNKNFASLLGGIPYGGSTSGTLSTVYRPTSNVTIFNAFSGTHDKVFGNPNDPSRPNYNSVTRISWNADAHTEFELGYTMDDQLGSNSPSVTETKDFVFRKKLFFIKKLNTFINYQNRKSKYYLSPSQDFNNNRILTGLSFRVIDELYAYYHREFNLLHNKFTGEDAFPTAQEMGLNFYKKIFNSPFYLNSRIFYRDEQQTESTLSYLSGEDRLEGEAELTYKPNPDTETFLKVRLANIWAEKAGVSKHMDFDFSFGLRMVWDTGLRWQSRGGFYGYCFYDLNSDGIKQSDEKGVKGAEITGPNGKSVTTDELGYFKFANVVGKKAILELSVKSLPKGYNPTTPTSREVEIVHGKSKRVDFGIATRSEISGLVFVDKDGNGRFDAGEEALSGVVLILDDKYKVASNLMGEFMFRKLSPGDHVVKFDLKSIPVVYIPKTPVSKNIKVIEGTTFIYNIPMEETGKK